MKSSTNVGIRANSDLFRTEFFIVLKSIAAALLMFMTGVVANAAVPGYVISTHIDKTWRSNTTSIAGIRPSYTNWSKFRHGYFWPDTKGIWCNADGNVDLYAKVTMYRKNGFRANKKTWWRPRMSAIVLDVPKGQKIKGLEILSAKRTRGNSVTVVLDGVIACKQGHQIQVRIYGASPGTKHDRQRFYPQTTWRITKFRLTVT